MNKQEPVNCSDSELCIFLRGLEAGCLPTYYSDTSPSVPSRSMSIASKSYQRGKKTVSFHGFQSLQMCKHLTDGHGEDSLMLWPVDSRARTSVSPEKVQDLTAPEAGYGASLPASFAKYDPATHSLKTAQLSLIEDLTGCSVTLPRSGWMRNGECYQQPTLVRRTYESASGFLPTPLASIATHGGPNQRDSNGRPGLQMAAMTWPKRWTTPSASDSTMGGTITEAMTGTSLAQQVNTPAKWPTPTASDHTGPGHAAQGGLNLRTAVQKWRTPSASVVDPKSTVVKLTGRKPSDPQVGLADQVGGQLNPNWVEWLMGWPIGWTDLKPLETGRFREWLQQHGECSQNEDKTV